MVRYNLCLMVLSAVILEANSASIDIELRIDLDSDNDEYKSSYRHRRHHGSPKVKKHFLAIDPTEIDSEVVSKPKLNTRSITDEEDEDLDPHYPQEKIKKYLAANPHLLKYFTVSVPDLGTRGGASDDEENRLCKGRKNSYYSPQKLPNIRNEIKTIINDDDHRQYIEREECVSNPDDKCSSIKLLGYTSKCEQQYTRRRLMVYTNRSGSEEFHFDVFNIPSCCVCKLQLEKSD